MERKVPGGRMEGEGEREGYIQGRKKLNWENEIGTRKRGVLAECRGRENEEGRDRMDYNREGDR